MGNCRLYYNGTILTMEQELYAEAVLTENGRILAVGKTEDLLSAKPQAQRVDLQGNVLLPSMLDPHSHLSQMAAAQLQVPLDEANSPEMVTERIATFVRDHKPAPGEWIICKGYDHNRLPEGRHPTIQMLDTCTNGHPLVIQHQSGHSGLFNSAALELLGITADTPAPEGGVIGVSNGELTGYLEENAYMQALRKVPMPDGAKLLAAYRTAQKKYASYGITTVQEGMFVSQMLPLYDTLMQQRMFMLDTVVYPEQAAYAELAQAWPQRVKRYDNRVKIGGVKMFLDGSPQGRTAWMRTPYAGEETYCGYGTMQDDAVVEVLRFAAQRELQTLAHCNGDAAAAQYLRCLETIEAEFPAYRDMRPVLIHGQLLGTDQLPDVRRCGVIPSFFAAHVYHWGDVHIQNFGRSRASSISPAGSARKQNIRFTLHQDAPVIEPNMLETVWCAVNRWTKGGEVLGEQERISPLEALRAVTMHAAWQYFEEDQKGSIASGKLANFVLLDQNPLTVEPMEIRNIQVLQTIREDKVVFSQ